MKKFKKIFASILAVSTMITAMTGVGASANATDRKITSFTIKANSYTFVSEGQKKDNTTSVYCYMTTANSAVQAQTWGGTSKDNLKKNLTYNPNTRKNCTYVTLSIGKQYQIYNTIADSPNYYSYAGLKLKSTNAIFSDTVSGCWSPDSVNTGSMPIATP